MLTINNNLPRWFPMSKLEHELNKAKTDYHESESVIEEKLNGSDTLTRVGLIRKNILQVGSPDDATQPRDRRSSDRK